MSDAYANLPTAPMSPVFALGDRFRFDTAIDLKANLGVGAFRDDNGKPWVLPTVLQAEEIILQKTKTGELNHEYLPIAGLPEFVSASIKFALGDVSPALADNRAGGVQTVGGTGAVALAAQFLGIHHPVKSIFIPNPTWGNHINIFTRAGMTVHKYRYYRAEDRALDFEGLIADLQAAPENAAVLLHACAHNPTGVDPTDDQWKVIAEVCKERNLFPVFDMAYQGFVSGDPDKDASAVRYFVSQGFSTLICQSFSKNLGLYNERVGCLTTVASSTQVTTAILSQLRVVVRSLWSNPSLHGGSIVATVLNSEPIQKQWRQELKSMSDRVLRMRKALYDALLECGAPGTWTHILNQRGLFTYSGLTAEQVRELEKHHHVFMLETGRMNMCGVTPGNVHRIAKAIRDVIENNGQTA